MRSRPAAIALAAIATASLVLAAASLGAVGSVLLVSGPNGETEAGFPSEQVNPAISADGHFIAFVGSVGETANGLYLRDMSAGIAEVDVPHGHSEHGIGFAAGSPSISSSGRYLAFASEDPDISSEDHNSSTTLAGDTFPVRDIFVYDHSTGRVSLVSQASGVKGAGGNEDSNLPSISADGRYVAFQTEATNFLHGSYGGIFVRDLRRHTTTPVASLLLVSRAQGKHGAAGSGDSSSPSISADGRYVAFESYASNLGPADNSTQPDVFVREMRSGHVFLASRADGNGPAANALSANPAISADGRYVAFDSRGSNLSPADTLHPTSVFRYQLLP